MGERSTGGDGTDADRVVREYLAAGDLGDEERLAQLLDDEVIVHSAGGVTGHGIASQIDSWRAAHRGLSELTHRVEEVVAVGELTAARVCVRGVHTGHFLGVAPTGAVIEVDQAIFARVESGRIVEVWEIVDTGHGLRQLGVLGDQALSPE